MRKKPLWKNCCRFREKEKTQSYSKWQNMPFDAPVTHIDHKLDLARRTALIHQTEDLMEQDLPILPVAWERVNNRWYTNVKGPDPTHYFDDYDVVHFDTIRLDK